MVKRRWLERKIKELLLEAAFEQGLPSSRLAERVEEEIGVRAPRDWGRLRRFILERDDIDERDLAVILVELGVRVPEEKWIEVVSKYSLKALRVRKR